MKGCKTERRNASRKRWGMSARIRAQVRERTKGRSAEPQISPVIVSQSLVESRQTIHRRRAETSSLEACSPPLNHHLSFFYLKEKRSQLVNRSMSVHVYSIRRNFVSPSLSLISPGSLVLSSSFTLWWSNCQLADNTDWKKGSHTEIEFSATSTPL